MKFQCSQQMALMSPTWPLGTRNVSERHAVRAQDLFGITGSDPALINKFNDAMDPLFGIPAEWFQLQPMRGLERDAHGLWQRHPTTERAGTAATWMETVPS